MLEALNWIPNRLGACAAAAVAHASSIAGSDQGESSRLKHLLLVC